jgi:hypothetical protein
MIEHYGTVNIRMRSLNYLCASQTHYFLSEGLGEERKANERDG